MIKLIQEYTESSFWLNSYITGNSNDERFNDIAERLSPEWTIFLENKKPEEEYDQDKAYTATVRRQYKLNMLELKAMAEKTVKEIKRARISDQEKESWLKTIPDIENIELDSYKDIPNEDLEYAVLFIKKEIEKELEKTAGKPDHSYMKEKASYLYKIIPEEWKHDETFMVKLYHQIRRFGSSL